MSSARNSRNFATTGANAAVTTSLAKGRKQTRIALQSNNYSGYAGLLKDKVLIKDKVPVTGCVFSNPPMTHPVVRFPIELAGSLASAR